jgi:hypothetical protein
MGIAGTMARREPTMMPDDLDDWIARHELTIERAAETLGRTDPSIYAY